MKRPTRHSYSSISTHDPAMGGCPARYKFCYIDGIEWPSSAAMTRGSRLHRMAEEFIKGEVPRIPHEISKIGPTLLALQSQGAKAEEVWLLDKDWSSTDDPANARIKAIIDVHYRLPDVVHVKDYKSGQMYEDHRDQLEFYGIIALCRYPDARRVETSAVYIDTGHEGMQGSIIRSMLPKMIRVWEEKIIAIETDEAFEPRPEARKCGRCPYSRDKGGPCQY